MPPLSKGNNMQAPEKKLNLNAIRAKLDGKRGEAYFKSLEDVAETPEFQSWIEDEFPNRSSLMEVDRRDFLKVMGASMALAGLAGCRSLVLPNDEAVPYVTAPEDITPGKALWFATAIPHNGSSLGVLVESHEGRPTKIEGNPDHASSKGKTDSFAQAELLNLYDPGRMVFCKKGELESTWEIALRDLRGLVDEHKKNGGKGFAVLTEPITSRALKTQLMGLKAQMPGMQIHQYSAVTSDSAVEGSAIAFGQRLQEIRQRAAVGRDVQPGVVAQVERRAVERARQLPPVVVAVAFPLPVVHAQAVDQQEKPAARARKRCGRRGAVERHRRAGVPHFHLCRERIAGCGEVVPEHAVQSGDDRIALLRRRPLRDQRHERAEQRVEARADNARHAADRAVDEPGDARGPPVRRGSEEQRRPGDRSMHRLDDVGQPGGRVDGETLEAVQVGGQDGRGLRGGGAGHAQV